MFKLQASKSEAEKLAKKEPGDYQVGSTAWVTARFNADKPMPKRLWEKWLDESYELSLAAAVGKKKTKNKTTKKKSVKKNSVKKAKRMTKGKKA